MATSLSLFNSWGKCPDANLFYDMSGAILFFDTFAWVHQSYNYICCKKVSKQV